MAEYYHYTSIEALFNIVRSKKVWFSSLAFMNDEMEGYDLHHVLAEVLELKYGSEKCKKTLNLIDGLIDVNLRFQMSFSATVLGDDISQWRAYTTLGQGVCICFEDGFIPNDIEKLVCLYDFDEKKEAIISDGNLKASDVTVNRLLQTPDGIQEYVGSIVKTLVRFKNRSFSPEREVRWVLSLDGLNDRRADIKYRPHRLGLATYQEVGVDLSKVKSITLGPQVPKQNMKTFEDYLIVNDCAGFVTKSSVSLR